MNATVDEQLHLYAVARTAIPLGQLVRILAEPVAGGMKILYTLETTDERDGDQRTFAILSSSIRGVDDKRLRLEIEAAWLSSL